MRRTFYLSPLLALFFAACGGDDSPSPEKSTARGGGSGEGGSGGAQTSGGAAGTAARGGSAGASSRGGSSGQGGTTGGGGGTGGTSGGTGGSAGSGTGGTGGRDLETCPEGMSCECDDGMDNDGDGLVDWEFDLGCSARNDATEGGIPSGTVEGGWTVFEPEDDTRIVYVSADGNDSADGLSPENARRTFQGGVDALRPGSADWLLFRRGDTFQGGRGGDDLHAVELPAGRSPSQPIVIATYGDELTRPTLTGFEIAFSDVGNTALMHVGFTVTIVGMSGRAANILVEGCSFTGEGGLSSIESKEDGPRRSISVRRNVASRTNTPFYFGSVDGLFIEENVIYRPAENGAGNHGMYITRVGNSNVVTRHNLVYFGPLGEGNGIKQRPGGIAEGNIIVETKIASLHFGACNDGNDSVCESKVEASALGNLIVSSGGIYFDPAWVTEGEARDNISADIPGNVEIPVEAPSSVTISNNIELRGGNSSMLGRYSADVLGGESTTVAFFEEAILQQKFAYRPELDASRVIDHVRENYLP